MVREKDIPKLDILKRVAQKVIPTGGNAWLYGSRARGDAKDDSDWDLLILLAKPTITPADEDTIAYPFVREGWMCDIDVSPQVYTVQEWKGKSFSPYYKNVERDKIPLI